MSHKWRIFYLLKTEEEEENTCLIFISNYFYAVSKSCQVDCRVDGISIRLYFQRIRLVCLFLGYFQHAVSRVELKSDNIVCLEGKGLEFTVKFWLVAAPWISVRTDEVTPMPGWTVVEVPVVILQLIYMAYSNTNPRSQLYDMNFPFFYFRCF